jgi:hypothetical protein
MKRAVYAIETKVPVARTRQEIEKELERFGATSFAFASQPGRASILFEFESRRVRFDLPLPNDSSESKTAKLHRTKWRALLLSIKAKLVSVGTGIETFEEAFLAHVVLADGSTVGQMARPAIEQQYKTGKMTPLLLGGPTSRQETKQ